MAPPKLYDIMLNNNHLHASKCNSSIGIVKNFDSLALKIFKTPELKTFSVDKSLALFNQLLGEGEL